jgi:hypothetical protein
VWTELSLEEPLGPKSVGFGVKVLAVVDQVGARAEHHPGWIFAAARHERRFRLPHNERCHGIVSQTLADRRIQIFKRVYVFGLRRPTASYRFQLIDQAIDDLASCH